jgi:hypothetical protein
MSKLKLNRIQEELLAAEQLLVVLLCGRATGKSFGLGLKSYQFVSEMPGSKGCFITPTYKQMKTKFLPEIKSAWDKLQLNQDIHYVVGVKPPKHFKRGLKPPDDWQHFISFINGSYIEMISMDTYDSARGGNYDWLMGDEAFLFNKERLDKEIFPCLRGNYQEFIGCPLHYQRVLATSMPWLSSGMWIADLEYNEEMKQADLLNFIEGTAYDNIQNLGKAYIKNLEATLPYWTFQVEVLNKRMSQLPDGFYANLREDRHLYIEPYNYKSDNFAILGRDAKDYDKRLPLEVSLDFGGKICCMLVGQEHKGADNHEFRFINALHAASSKFDKEGDSLIHKLCASFAKEYGGQPGTVIVTADRNGDTRIANSNLTYIAQVLALLKAHGFNVIYESKGENPAHSMKHFALNALLSEDDVKLPIIRINRERCKNLILSMQGAMVLPDFKKDKSSERKEGNQEKATHFSDCFDYVLIGKYLKKFPKSANSVRIAATTG